MQRIPLMALLCFRKSLHFCRLKREVLNYSNLGAFAIYLSQWQQFLSNWKLWIGSSLAFLSIIYGKVLCFVSCAGRSWCSRAAWLPVNLILSPAFLSSDFNDERTVKWQSGSLWIIRSQANHYDGALIFYCCTGQLCGGDGNWALSEDCDEADTNVEL